MTELVEEGWAFACGVIMTGCAAAEGMDLLPRSDLVVAAAGVVVTAECVGTEAVACNGLAAGGAGETVIGEGLGMVTVACMGRGAGVVVEAGLLAE